MPGVSVLPMSPVLGGFGSPPPSATSNGFPRSYDNMTVAEIKEKAKEEARKHSRGASPLSLIGAARKLSLAGQDHELSGDLRAALSAFTKAASLAQMCMNSAEFAADAQPGKKGLLYKEFLNFQQHEGSNLKEKIENVEAKLAALEKAASFRSTASEILEASDGPVRKSGGSIADRMKSLQDAGLKVSTTKRLSREIPILPPSAPMSPETIRTHRSSQSLSSPLILSSALSTPLIPSSSIPSPHAFVSPSTLGPPSPTSSTSSSPRTSTQFSLSEFSQTFPSIDELDEIDSFSLPPVPTGSTSEIPKSSPTDLNLNGETELSRSFPALPMDPGPRPSSTPLTPIANAFISRPASPVRSPTVRHRPSGLGLSSVPSSSPNKSPGLPSGSSSPDKIDLPVTNSVFPSKLYEYIHGNNLKVLLLDVRTREEFDREHIRGDAVVCIEPSVLQRETVTSSTLEDSLNVGPRAEWAMFCNREKFDIVALYNNSSESFGSSTSPMTRLTRAIYETEFRKHLKRMPMLLVGGLQAWKEDLGEDDLVRAETEVSEPQKPVIPPGSPVISNFVPSVINSSASSSSVPEVHRLRTSRSRASTIDKGPSLRSEVRYSVDTSISRPPVDINGYQSVEAVKPLVRRPPLPKPVSASASPSSYSRNIVDNVSGPSSLANGSSSIQYPQFPRTTSPAVTGSSPFSPSTGNYNMVSPPPQASINPTLSRRRSDYIDQSQQALSGLNSRPSIDYPDLSSQHILRPPPAAASSALERQDNRPRVLPHTQSYPSSHAGPKPPTIQSDYPVPYWSDVQIATTGLRNLGNTCYMNSTIQCLSATAPFARFFTDGRWKSAVNMVNPLGTKGNLANAFATILHEMRHQDLPYLSPLPFRRTIANHASQFAGPEQHDSQEFLSFLLDGLHEDLNRVLNKPSTNTTPEREAELERLPQQIASETEWTIYRMRNDSLIVDFFQGQFRNRLECLTCHKTSTTYNTFMYLTLPVPTGRGSSKVSLHQCLDAFVKTEVMEKNDAWHCPSCKTLRKATKQLSLSRLPPVLLIHLKRFSFKGPFTDKIETFVDFPLRGLDLTNYMLPPLAPGTTKMQLNPAPADDPRSQLPPYRYDLYGVTNHFGSLSSGHYTASIASRGGWLYCDDSRVVPIDPKEVVGRPAYVLYYKRTKS